MMFISHKRFTGGEEQKYRQKYIRRHVKPLLKIAHTNYTDKV